MTRRSRTIFAVIGLLILAGAIALWFSRSTVGDDEGISVQQSPPQENWWVEWLSRGQVVLERFDLQPGESKTIDLPQRPAWVGVLTNRGWDLRERQRMDQKEYAVRITRNNDGRYVGTILSASTNFGESVPGEKFTVSNQTPLALSVVVYGHGK